MSFLSKVSAITNQVAKVAGAFSGPYGLAVTFGGSILSRVIKGIDFNLSSKNLSSFILRAYN